MSAGTSPTEAAALKAQVMSQVLYDDSFQSVTAPELLYAFSGNDRLLKLSRDAVVGKQVWEVALTTGAARSESRFLTFVLRSDVPVPKLILLLIRTS